MHQPKLISPVPCKYWPKFPLSICSYTRKRDPSTQYPIKRTCGLHER